jgi:predicted transcriptional regulator
MFSGKRELTYDEKLRAAYACLINGVHQHHIAALYGVNQGRISEAVKMVEKACGFPGKAVSGQKDAADEFGMPYTTEGKELARFT